MANVIEPCVEARIGAVLRMTYTADAVRTVEAVHHDYQKGCACCGCETIDRILAEPGKIK